VRLKVYDGSEKIHEITLEPRVISLGRDSSSDVVLADASVSRRHAQLEPTGNFFLIRDNGSTNGTFVNEMLVRTQVLTHGDIVRVGKYLIRVDAGLAQSKETTRVRVEQLRLPGRPPKDGKPQTVTVRFETEAPLQDAGRERLLRLHEIQREIGYVDVLQTLLERTLDILLAELGARRGSVLFCERSASPRSFHAAAVRTIDPGGKHVETEEELVISEELLIQATTRLHALRSRVRPEGGGPEIPCLVCPLRDRLAVLGVIYIDRPAGSSEFTAEDAEFLSALAVQVGISISNSQLFEEVSAAREMVQAVFTSLCDGVIVVDPDFRITEANTAATILLGTEDRNLLGAGLLDLLHAYDVHPDIDVLHEASLDEGAVFHWKRKGNGETNPQDRALLSGTAVPYQGAGGETKGVVFSIRSRTELERLEELKSRFIGNVAHKLRSPLTVIQGNLALLRSEEMRRAPDPEIIDEVGRSAEALCRMVDEFMEYAELEVRALQGEDGPKLLPLRPIVREALRMVESEARRKGLLIVDRLKDDLPSLRLRKHRILRALQSIIENAVKFTTDRGQVIIEAEVSEGYVRIDVADDGPGIPAREIESVFYVCHQVDEERTGQVPGAGMGLSLSRHIVQEHGGEIRITSPHRFPDHGTRVSVFLPLATSARGRDPEVASASWSDDPGVVEERSEVSP